MDRAQNTLVNIKEDGIWKYIYIVDYTKKNKK